MGLFTLTSGKYDEIKLRKVAPPIEHPYLECDCVGNVKGEKLSQCIRIELNEDEIKILLNGETIQTQYSWLTIRKKV